MKIAVIKEFLDQYEKGKGYLRWVINESHIRELYSFYNGLDEKKVYLTPEQLLKLALILIRKNTRTNTKESGKAFEGLVSPLGGYKALDTLNQAGKLTVENVVFLEQHPLQAQDLAPLIVTLSPLSPALMKIIFKAAKYMKKKEELPHLFREFIEISKLDYAPFYFNILALLNKHQFNSDEVFPLLKEVKKITFIKSVLFTLEELNPTLITSSNLLRILKLKQPYYFEELLKILLLPNKETPSKLFSADQETLNKLFSADETLNKCTWADEIIKNFNTAKWDIKPYLSLILSPNISGWDLKSATDKLMKLSLKPEILAFVLQTIFERLSESIELVNAVETLTIAKLEKADQVDTTKDLIELVFSFKFPDKIATAIVTLKEADNYDNSTRDYVCSNPEYAPGLAQFRIQLKKVAYRNQAESDAMLKNPQCAAFTAMAIEFLQQNLHEEKNILAVCQAKLTSHAFLSLLQIMKQAKLLDQTNLDKVFFAIPFIKTLYNGTRCLEFGEKLNPSNFDLIVNDSINAVSIAEILGGRISPANHTYFKVQGAQNLTNIRNNTRLLFQGHRQGLFFPTRTEEEIMTFEEQSKKKLHTVQDEALKKIAAYSGDHSLEEETERYIVESTYNSIKR